MSQVRYNFSGRTALVVGGTTGIGRACTLAFAGAGANVVVGGVGLADKVGFEAELIRVGASAAIYVETDVRNEAAVEALVAAAAQRFGRIDMAMNNAGIEGPYGPLHEVEAKDFDNLIAVNLRGVWLGMKHQARQMLAQGGGAIVNTASTAGLRAIPSVGVYSATKHGIIGLTKAAAQELASGGIRVNAIAPGPVDTGLLSRMIEGQIPVDAIAQAVPLGRISKPSEIAPLVLWLCSEAASFVTGETVLIDGGLTL